MHFKLKVQKMGTLHLCLYFKIKSVKAKLKFFSLLNLKKQTNEKKIQRFLTKQKMELYTYFVGTKTYTEKSQKTNLQKISIKINNEKRLLFHFSF